MARMRATDKEQNAQTIFGVGIFFRWDDCRPAPKVFRDRRRTYSKMHYVGYLTSISSAGYSEPAC